MLHQHKRSKDSLNDDWWTPKSLYENLCKKYNIYPKLDVAATSENSKCQYYLGDALHQEWTIGGKDPETIWCNPPFSMTDKFIRRAESQYAKYGMRMMMIVPANVLSSKVWHELIEGKREYHAVEGRPKFLNHGRPSKFPSRNAYVVILWHKTY